MRVDVITERRKFNLTNITEEEGLILRTLLNQSDGSLLISIMADKPYWEDDIKTDKEAIEIAVDLRNKIFGMVDKK